MGDRTGLPAEPRRQRTACRRHAGGPATAHCPTRGEESTGSNELHGFACVVAAAAYLVLIIDEPGSINDEDFETQRHLSAVC